MFPRCISVCWEQKDSVVDDPVVPVVVVLAIDPSASCINISLA